VHADNIEVIYTAEQIAARVAELGTAIRSDAGDAPVFLLGVLKGTSCFAADLMRAIDGDVGFGFIDVVRDVSDQQVADVSDALVAHALEIDYLNFISLTGKNVYVLKDVVSTGVIETYLLTQLRQKQPASLKLVAMLDRPNLRTNDLEADFRAFEPGDGVFAGYGLELEGRFGNLPWLGRVK
jgi:hypoxanthine phosphoribosyltransferase